MAKGFLEMPAAYLLRQVAGRTAVKDRPEGDHFTEWASCYATKEKQGGVLGFDNERFESAGGNNAEIRIGHTFRSTTFLADSKAAWRLRGGLGRRSVPRGRRLLYAAEVHIGHRVFSHRRVIR